MKFIFISDTHFGGKDLSGFQMQPRYVEHGREIFAAIDRLVRQENADMVISGGDLTDNGSVEEISMVVELAKENLSVPLYLALGNHDCMQEDCTGVWLKNAPEFFPDGKVDTTIIRDGVRIDILSLLWGRERTWRHEDGQLIRLSEEHYELLRSGEQNLPRILVMHCQLAPARPEQTGLEEDLMVPENNFAAAGKALINEFHPKLVLSGHIHINLLDQIDGTFAAAVSSTAETPFDCKVVEITEKKVTMRTVPLVPELGFEPEYWEERKYVQGDKNIREFEA